MVRSVFVGLFRDDTKEYLLHINEQLSERVKFLEEIIRTDREDKTKLLNQILYPIKNKPVDITNMQPIGGYKNLKMRIAEAEEKSRREFHENQDKENASEER